MGGFKGWTSYLGFVLLLGIILFAWLYLLTNSHYRYNPPNLISTSVIDSTYPEYSSENYVLSNYNFIQADVLDQLTLSSSNNEINITQSNLVNNLLKRGTYARGLYDSDRTSLDRNRSLYGAYVDVFRSNVLIWNFRLAFCYNESVKKIDSMNFLFFDASYDDYSTARKYAREMDLLKDTSSIIQNSQPTRDISEAIRQLRGLTDKRREYLTQYAKCQAAYSTIAADYNYQKSTLIVKILVLVGGALGIFLIAGITLAQLKNVSKNGIRSTKESLGFITYFFNPGKVNEDVIRLIISLNSTISIILAISGFLLQAFLRNNYIIFFTMIFSIIGLMLSILTGIVSINKKSPKLRKYSYVLFIAGQGLFVFFLIELFILVNTGVVISSIGTALHSFYNSTG